MSKLIVKKCVVCGKWFATTGKKKDTCSKECEGKKIRRRRKKKRAPNEKFQLCWLCQNATGGCSWSKCFIPVEGWTAKPAKIDEEDTYCITECPEFIQD